MAKAKKTTPKPPAKITRGYKTASFANFENAAKRLKISYPELSSALGYAPHSFAKWEELKLMPRVAQLACEGLCRRHRNGPTTEVVIQASKAKVIAGLGHVKEIHPGLFVVEL